MNLKKFVCCVNKNLIEDSIVIINNNMNTIEYQALNHVLSNKFFLPGRFKDENIPTPRTKEKNKHLQTVLFVRTSFATQSVLHRLITRI